MPSHVSLLYAPTNLCCTYGTHSMRRTKVTQIYKKTGNRRAVQLLLGHTKMDSTLRYLGVELEDALEIAEALENLRNRAVFTDGSKPTLDSSKIGILGFPEPDTHAQRGIPDGARSVVRDLPAVRRACSPKAQIRPPAFSPATPESIGPDPRKNLHKVDKLAGDLPQRYV